MSIKIKIDPDPQSEPEPIIISLEVRKTLDGKIMILDHLLIDIVLDTQQNKIVLFPKNSIDDEIYHIQDSYFNHLRNEGIILADSIVSGNVFGSLEATYPNPVDESISAAQVILLATKKFIDSENPKIEAQEYIENEIEDYLVDPTDSDSTELGEVPQEPKKGSQQSEKVRSYLSGYGYY